LIDEPIIALSPTLARQFGLEGATFLQQTHFRTLAAGNDRLGRFRTLEHCGAIWVSWTSEALLVDIPLGGAGSTHKRVISELKQAGVLRVEQLAKSEWNRSNFFRIDYDALNAIVSREPDPPRGLNDAPDQCDPIESNQDFDSIESGVASRLNVRDQAPQVKEEKTSEGEERVTRSDVDNVENMNLPLESLRRRLERLVGRTPRDNQEWDHKRIASTISAIEQGHVTIQDVETLVDRNDIRFLSQLDRQIRDLVQARAAEVRRAEQADAERRERERIRIADEQAKAAADAAQARLESASDDEIKEITAKAEKLALVPTVASRVREAIARRSLDRGMVRAAILAAMKLVRGGDRPEDIESVPQ
jgi:hypothetical protein